MTDEISRESLHDILRGVAALTGDAIVTDLARLVGKGVRAGSELPIRCAGAAQGRPRGEGEAREIGMTEASMRIDKWLWHARFARSRTLAQKLVQSGSVRVNRAAVRSASHPVRVGDALTVRLGSRILVARVLAFGERRGPAVEAQTLYEIVADSAARHDNAPEPALA